MAGEPTGDYEVLDPFPRFGARPSYGSALQAAGRWGRLHRWSRVFFFGNLLFLVALGYFADQAERAPGLREYSQELLASDFSFEGGGHFDMWFCILEAGQAVSLEMRSGAFLPYLMIMGVSDDDPSVLAKGDEVADGVARLDFVASGDDEYLIFATSFENEQFGGYALSSTARLEYADANPFATDTTIDSPYELLMFPGVVLFLLQLSGLVTLVLWRNPDRILLLRPFEQRNVSRSLKRFNRRNLALRGYTFTLADKHVRSSLTMFLIAHLPADIGDILVALYRPLFRRIHRYLFIRKPSDLQLVSLRLRARLRLASWWQSWLGLGDRIMKIRSKDHLWKDVIGILLDNCQVLVVDVSHAGEGTEWEIKEIVRRDLLYKTVFLVQDDDEEALRASRLLEGIDAAADLHRYDPKTGRLSDEQLFGEAYARAVSSELQPSVPALEVSLKAVVALAPLFVVGPLWSLPSLGLAWSALRDIRQAKGRLAGEMLAHMAIALNLAFAAIFMALVIAWTRG